VPEIKCEDPTSSLVDFVSPVSGNRILFCQTRQNGNLVKHGLEVVLNSKGEELSRKYYQDGKESAIKSPPTAEKSDKVLQDQSREAFKRIISALIPLLPTDKFPKDSFNIRGCTGDRFKLIKLVALNRGFTEDYQFEDRCDVEGRLSPLIAKPFEAQFKLRNLNDFTFVKMTLLLTIKHESEGIRVSFEAQKGELTSPKSSIIFNGHYSFLIEAATAQVQKNEGGIFRTISINGKPISFAEKILIE